MITLVIVEENEITRLGLHAAFAQKESFEVLGLYANSRDMLQKLSSLKPDVALLGEREFTENEVRVGEQIRKASPSTRILVMVEEERDDDLLAILSAGASGRVPRSAAIDGLARSIGIVADGGLSFEAKSLVRATKEFQSRKSGEMLKNSVNLTDREKYILGLIAQGLKNDEIAGELKISGSTVRNGISRIRDKLDIDSRAKLVSYAVRHGLHHNDEI